MPMFVLLENSAFEEGVMAVEIAKVPEVLKKYPEGLLRHGSSDTHPLARMDARQHDQPPWCRRIRFLAHGECSTEP